MTSRFPEEGGIILWRRIFLHRYWNDGKPYTPLKAWIDCLRRAAWIAHDRYYHGHLVHLEPGQFVTSQPELAHDWRWSRARVRRFLGCSQREHEASITPTSYGTIITIAGLTDNDDGRPGERPLERTAKGQLAASSRPPIEERREREESPLTNQADHEGPPSTGYPQEAVGRVFEAFQKASKRIRPATPIERERIREAVEANGGDWRSIAEYVRDVTASAVRDGQRIRSVTYGLEAWKNLRASESREPRRPVPSGPKPAYHEPAKIDRTSQGTERGGEHVRSILRRLGLGRKEADDG